MKRNPVLPIVVACGIAMGTAATATAAPADGKYNDTWSEAALATTYTLNRHLNPFKIDVEVKDGTALLTGTVDSEVERDLAGELALGVEGVDKVENHLKVEPGTKITAPDDDGFMSRVNDANITAKVKSQLLWNSNTEGLQIDVDTDNRVVTLKGEVSSEAEADLAEQIARNTSDVRDVNNRLKVSGDASLGKKVKREARDAGEEVSDAWITAKVKSALIYNRSIDGTDIDVDTSKGVVSLKGTVDSGFEKKEAVSIASDIRGVKKVKDALQVRSSS